MDRRPHEFTGLSIHDVNIEAEKKNSTCPNNVEHTRSAGVCDQNALQLNSPLAVKWSILRLVLVVVVSSTWHGS